MDHDLNEAMSTGLVVDFQDGDGTLVGQAVYLEWCGRPLPGRGETVAFAVEDPQRAGQTLTIAGRVRWRRYELEQRDDAAPSIWVRLAVDVQAPARAAVPAIPAAAFSLN